MYSHYILPTLFSVSKQVLGVVIFVNLGCCVRSEILSISLQYFQLGVSVLPIVSPVPTSLKNMFLGNAFGEILFGVCLVMTHLCPGEISLENLFLRSFSREGVDRSGFQAAGNPPHEPGF